MNDFLKKPIFAISINFGTGILTLWQIIEPYCSIIAFIMGIIIGVFSLVNAAQTRRINNMNEKMTKNNFDHYATDK